MPSAALKTDIGWLDVTVDEADTTITALRWRHKKPKDDDSTPLLDKAVAELRGYLAGARRNFDLPLHAEGDDLARAVWEIMLEIPYGQTLTYGDVAKRLNVAAQDIGQACGRNPIPVLIPCHRITGTNWLGGYSSDLGTTAKRFLLDLERGQGRLF
jgi:methylated-DNA-[protein]-cysteine S-methyltransferase